MDLFDAVPDARPSREDIAEGAVLLRGYATPVEAELIAALREIVAQAPFRRMLTPGGHQMSVAMTNCGDARLGHRSHRLSLRSRAIRRPAGRWPAMPPLFVRAGRARRRHGGFPDFAPDACLINRYEPGARMSLHQDRDEQDFAAPIVSVSLGLPAIFLFGGPKRSDKPRGIGSSMATSWSGAGRRGCSFTASRRSPTASTG